MIPISDCYELHKAIDGVSHAMNNWVPSLFLDCFEDGEPKKNVDVIKFTGKGNVVLDKSLVFDRDLYSVEGGFKGSGWNKLKKYIMRQAIQSGYMLFSNGQPYNSPQPSHILKCKHSKMYQDSLEEILDQ